MAKWIWKFGEFEIYHNMLVHGRREAYGYKEAPVWKIYAPEPVIDFRKHITTDGGWIDIYACGDFSVSQTDTDGNRSFETRGASHVYLQPGSYILEVRVMNHKTFPALYIEGIIETDETWLADDFSLDFHTAGTWNVFDRPEKKPDVFPFAYQSIPYEQKEILPGEGVLFDFGRETFARIHVSGLTPGSTFRIQYGESRDEALDPEWSVIHFDSISKEGNAEFPPYAFRYIYMSDPKAELQAEYEYLPIAQKGRFSSDHELLNKIWDTAAYTFHLNCREFIFDGIKRDRWVWSADVYQSLFVNRYLFFDKDLEQRTLIALAGKAPFRRHINTIVDYTFFWFMSLYEHYQTYGDINFIRRIKPRMDEIMQFCLMRTGDDGFIRGIPGDWIFIDWAPMDKTGAVCGEQILYSKALSDYSKLCRILECEDKDCGLKSRRLQQMVFEKFWDSEKNAFIDSFESGKRNVTRQSNILAYLFLPCTKEQRDQIYKNVIQNDSVPEITTPYFKFYENQVHCLSGNTDFLEEMLASYYGSMLETGATSLYEQYDPKDIGAENYAMYGRKFEKSLCHAWSSSPIYLLGRFRLGVAGTDTAYRSYEVRPRLGSLQKIEGVVPVPGGTVYVKADQNEVVVRSPISGGTLFVNGNPYVIEKEKELRIKK